MSPTPKSLPYPCALAYPGVLFHILNYLMLGSEPGRMEDLI
nr:MAG TPA: hypothetical protein [Caudoviricetes sp.]